MYVNRVETRAVISSMNAQNKQSDWSREKLGMAKITVKDADKLGENDRLTVLQGESYYTEALMTRTTGDNIEFAILSYPCSEVDVAYMFTNANVKNTQLVEGVDFTITDNVLKMTEKWANNLTFDNNGNPVGRSISLRYKHRPVYHIVDLLRDTMLTDIFVDESFGNESFQMPVHAIGKRAHYIVGVGGLNGSELFDNSTVEY